MFRMDKNLARKLMIICGIAFQYICVEIVSAQTPTLDYFGEIISNEHPPGYTEFVQMGCYQCHGFQGASDRPLVANLMPFEAFVNQVRRPYGVMPAYSSTVLSDSQLRLIYEYLGSISEAEDVSDIPLLNK